MARTAVGRNRAVVRLPNRGHLYGPVVVLEALGVQDALHSHTADNIVLTQDHNLVVQDASHAHTADNIVLTQVHNLVIQDALHSHTADNITLATAGGDTGEALREPSMRRRRGLSGRRH